VTRLVSASSCGPASTLKLKVLDDGAEKAFVVADRNDLGALHAFHQHLDVAVGSFRLCTMLTMVPTL
jgi:hypothetical protein